MYIQENQEKENQGESRKFKEQVSLFLINRHKKSFMQSK